jgi:CheY-like chemotaxis protein
VPGQEKDDSINLDDIEFEPASILIADNIPLNRSLIKGYLKNTNIEVIEADNGHTCLQFAKRYKPDLILSSIRMPVMDGFDTVRSIKQNEELRNIPVVAVTGTRISDIQEKALESGFEAFLPKPLRNDELLALLTRYLKYYHKDQDEKERKEVPKSEGPGRKLSGEPDYEKAFEQLSGELFSTWESVSKQPFFDVIEEFARKLLRLGRETNTQEIFDYGRKVRISVQKFDIEEMTKVLEEFPKIFDTVKKQAISE